MKYLSLFFLIGCSFYSSRDNYETHFDKIMNQALRSWKNKEKQETVEAHFLKASNLARLDRDSERRIWAHHEWGRYLLSVKDLENARMQFLRSSVFNEDFNDPLLQFHNTFNLGVVYYEKKDFKASCDFLNQSRLSLEKIYAGELYPKRRDALKKRLLDFGHHINCTYAIF